MQVISKLDTNWTLYDDKLHRQLTVSLKKKKEKKMQWLLHFVLKASDLISQWQSDFMFPVHLFTYFWMTSRAKLESVWIIAGNEK